MYDLHFPCSLLSDIACLSKCSLIIAIFLLALLLTYFFHELITEITKSMAMMAARNPTVAQFFGLNL
jgi:hypothetical protein